MAVPRPVATPGRRFPPNNTKTMAKIMVNSQAPIPSIQPSSFSESNLASPFLKEKDNVSTQFSGHEIIVWATKLLTEAGIDNAELDARIMLEHVLELPRTHSYFAQAYKLLPHEEMLFFNLLKRRLMHEPIAYLVGQKEFYGYDFLVNSSCLIPRPDTESVVEHCLARLKGHERVLDVCTGSGAIGLTLVKERPHISLVATDISSQALEMAHKNARQLGVEKRVNFRKGDMFEVLLPHERFELIVSNPPYISPDDYENLSRTVKDFEPELALNAKDSQGISFYRRLLEEAGQYLREGGCLVMEIGYQQSEMVKSLAGSQWSVELFNDLAHNPRVVIATRS